MIYEENKQAEPLEENDVKYMAKIILNVVNIMREEVYMDTPDTIETVNKLEHIAKLILMGRYQELILDASIITKEMNELCNNVYRQMTHE